jgi:hypothetical protein
MTATRSSRAQEAPASPLLPATLTADQPSLELERQRRRLQTLTTEHFTLQTARSATITDSNGRSALYLATVSSAVVALRVWALRLATQGQRRPWRGPVAAASAERASSRPMARRRRNASANRAAVAAMPPQRQGPSRRAAWTPNR